MTTTNIKGDSHESAYLEGQRSVLLFIKSNAAIERKMKMSKEQITQKTVPVETDIYRSTTTSNTNNCCKNRHTNFFINNNTTVQQLKVMERNYI